MVLTTCGKVWGCGWGHYGQLGAVDTADRHALVRVGGVETFGPCWWERPQRRRWWWRREA